MPLFNACGVTSMKKTFNFASCFMSGETATDFTWVITAIGELLESEGIAKPQIIVTDRDLGLLRAIEGYEPFNGIPHILCRWHANMNVLSKCKQHFPKAKWDPATRKAVRAAEFTRFLEAWNALANAETEALFNQKLEHFKEAGRFPDAAVSYVLNTWITPWKEKIVRCFVDRYRHFGYVTTSIVEPANAAIKRFLWGNTGDLSTVFRHLENFWRYQLAEIQGHERQRYNKLFNYTRKLLRNMPC
ncbi:uncharacterized protein CPUR_07339 [Claviceps purpurea 20.1]|uniref:MULE transposase domain-containing protein n=1 Tax=Claviceps purpurea (strain 20.1) TaxID=1111077 RepID=M1WB48_CLAP2|nr:uncharacterized protein CPUR_07339 [Claviceps purpurea 20.1]